MLRLGRCQDLDCVGQFSGSGGKVSLSSKFSEVEAEQFQREGN